MPEEYADDEFIFNLPLWFVVDERATRIAPQGHRELLDRRMEAFCGGVVDGKPCVLLFTDEDLAERHARNYQDCVPLGCNNAAALKELLVGFYPNGFHSVILDIGSQPLTNKRVPIPDFIKVLNQGS